MTPAQRFALEAIRDGRGGSPAQLGRYMMQRPGYSGKKWMNAQAQGRLGGTMMARLNKLGFVNLISYSYGHFHPTRAEITKAGEAALLQ